MLLASKIGLPTSKLNKRHLEGPLVYKMQKNNKKMLKPKCLKRLDCLFEKKYHTFEFTKNEGI